MDWTCIIKGNAFRDRKRIVAEKNGPELVYCVQRQTRPFQLKMWTNKYLKTLHVALIATWTYWKFFWKVWGLLKWSFKVKEKIEWDILKKSADLMVQFKNVLIVLLFFWNI